MSAAIARALTMIAVVLQSYFHWDSHHDDTKTDLSTDKHSTSTAVYHLAGLVLARGGSKGIPKKNLAKINGQPLIGRALDAMIESGVFTSIWVSTDDKEISAWVRAHYAKEKVAIHNRAAYTATDAATSMVAVLEFLGMHPEIDAIGLVQATSPFVKPKFLREAADLLLHSKGKSYHDSVFSVTKSHQLRWSTVKSPSENTKPLNFNPKARPRRQDWAGEMVENGMFYFVLRDIVMNYQVFQTERSGYVEIPKHLSMEVDSSQDLEIAKCLAMKFDGDEKERRKQGYSYDHDKTHKTNKREL